MATSSIEKNSIRTVADLMQRLGNVPPERILFNPLPGTATEQDVISAEAGVDKQLCELVDGTLVEKAVDTLESNCAIVLGHYLMVYLDRENLGLVFGADGMVRLWQGRVRIPDLMFIPWDKLPEDGELPDEAITSIIPDLAVEVLSPSNTKAEMRLKRSEYFKAGVRLVWIIDPKTQTAEVYTAPKKMTHIEKSGSLDGGDVLPGFHMALRKLFQRKRPPKS